MRLLGFAVFYSWFQNLTTKEANKKGEEQSENFKF